jgi:hypothetical protein
MLAAGQAIDFSIGYGANKTYNYDNTGISVSIVQAEASVPEPGTLAGMCLGIGLLGVSRRRLRR